MWLKQVKYENIYFGKIYLLYFGKETFMHYSIIFLGIFDPLLPISDAFNTYMDVPLSK